MTETAAEEPVDENDRRRMAAAPDERDVQEVRGAIELVASGWARVVVLCGLRSPRVAAELTAAYGRAVGVPVSLRALGDGPDELVVGPLGA